MPDTTPGSVQLAELLMYVSGGLAFVRGLLVGLATGALVGWLVVALVESALWVWMARANRDGKSWARIVGTALFGLNTLAAVLTVFVELGYLYVGSMRALIALGIFQWALSLVVVMLLWSRESSRYYQNIGQARHPAKP